MEKCLRPVSEVCICMVVKHGPCQQVHGPYQIFSGIKPYWNVGQALGVQMDQQNAGHGKYQPIHLRSEIMLGKDIYSKFWMPIQEWVIWIRTIGMFNHSTKSTVK